MSWLIHFKLLNFCFFESCQSNKFVFFGRNGVIGNLNLKIPMCVAWVEKQERGLIKMGTT